MSPLSRRVCTLGWIAVAALAPARADDNTKVAPSASDPKAVSLYKEVAAAYKKLPAYADQGRFVVAMRSPSGPKTFDDKLAITFVPPNRIKIESKLVEVVSDGKTWTQVVKPFRRYLRTSAPKSLTLEDLRLGAGAAELFGTTARPGVGLMLALLLEPDRLGLDGPGAPIISFDSSSTPAAPVLLVAPPALVTKSADKTASNAAATFLEARRLRIDPTSKLILAVDTVIEPAAPRPNSPFQVDRIAWEAVAISAKVPADETFDFKPAAGFQKTKTLDEDVAGGPANPVQPH